MTGITCIFLPLGCVARARCVHNNRWREAPSRELRPSHLPPELPIRKAAEHRLPLRRDAKHRDLPVLRAKLARGAIVEARDGPALLGVGRVRIAAKRGERREAACREIERLKLGTQRTVREVVLLPRRSLVAWVPGGDDMERAEPRGDLGRGVPGTGVLDGDNGGEVCMGYVGNRSSDLSFLLSSP